MHTHTHTSKESHTPGRSLDWGGSGELALGIDELCGVEKVAARVALVAPGVLERCGKGVGGRCVEEVWG